MRGKRQPYVHCLSSSRDHPRGCGENSEVKRMNVFNLGSPPRMRGKPVSLSIMLCFIEDHPRGCGENLRDWVARNAAAGSPPRMRGKRLSALLFELSTGITPADAGKTRCKANSRHGRWDHPRGCGENLFLPAILNLRQGSPPRMRGKLNGEPRQTSRARITPADAGKTVPAMQGISPI